MFGKTSCLPTITKTRLEEATAHLQRIRSGIIQHLFLYDVYENKDGYSPAKMALFSYKSHESHNNEKYMGKIYVFPYVCFLN